MTIYPIPVILFVPQLYKRLHAPVYVTDFDQLQSWLLNIQLIWYIGQKQA